MGRSMDALVIQGGRVIDGTGAEPRPADVLVRGGMVEAVTAPGAVVPPGAEVFRAENRVVCPGFIDVHAHDDLYLLVRPEGKYKVRQGVTTVIGGNCGISAAPLTGGNRSGAEEQLALMGVSSLPPEARGFPDFKSHAAALERAGLGIHYAGLVGHGMLRLAAMGPADSVPAFSQMRRMCDLLDLSLDQGAVGLSLGLIYAPGAYAGLNELVDLARVVRSHQGVVAAHIRSEGGGVIEAVDEMIRLARLSGAAVHISHHKTADPANRGTSRRTLDMIDKARDEGLAVTADAYPYCAGSTCLAAVLPVRVMARGMEVLRSMLGDPSFRADLQREIHEDPLDRWRSLITGRGDYRLTFAHCPARPDYVGRVLAEIAEEEGRSPYDVIFDRIAAEGMDVGMVIHSMAEEDVRRILSHPAVMIGSDGIPLLDAGKPHPRLTGTFPRVLGRYVRELGLIGLPEAVRRMTSLPARTFGLAGRGRLDPGTAADIAVFDPDTVIDRSTYAQPERAPRGIDLVLVGGRPACIHGRMTGEGRGCVIRRGG